MLSSRAFTHSSLRSFTCPFQKTLRPSPLTSSLNVSRFSQPKKFFSTERDVDQCDVVIVGAGPSGLSAAIKLKQLSEKSGKDLRITVVEKAAEVGRHILSGAVIEPRALNELLPDWKNMESPIQQEVTDDSFLYLTKTSSFKFPITPSTLHNKGNYIVSLSNVVRWLGEVAEGMGIEIYPGIAASEVLFDESGSVKGIATNDVGVGKDGQPKDSYQPGMELHARLTLFAEGCRGHLTKRLFDKFELRKGVGHQTYGIGIKELWEISPEKFHPGSVIHTTGWPMDYKTYGGSFLYHFGQNMISTGFVVGLDYENPYMSPYKEFQRWKHHPSIAPIFEGGKCVSYGARAISEGGLQALPKLHFPGGALIGDTAGFLNVPKIKGTHNAMKSGMVCAETAFEHLTDSSKEGKPILLENYKENIQKSWLWDDLNRVRNIRPAFQYGFWAGMSYSAVDTYVLRGKAPWTLQFKHADHEATKPASECTPIEYPKPDGKISFDLLTNLARSGTNHEADQPVHLTLKNDQTPVQVNYKKYAGLENRFCPAGVYEYVEDDKGNPKLQINAQNCIHCKTCDIKDPTQNINWVTPEGSGGPLYEGM